MAVHSRMRHGWKTWMIATLLASCPSRLVLAAEEPAKQDAGTASVTKCEPAASQPAEAKKPAHYVSKAWGVNGDGERPKYVKSLDQAGLKDMDWLDFGLEHRTRFELRDDDYRRAEFQTDEPFQLRSRGYVGVKKILDPFRFVFEFSDGRQFNSKYPDTVSDVDENDIYQMYGQLYFKDALGPGLPVSLDVGRMALEYVDRKLVHRSSWRGTTNSFEGFRLRLGEAASDWQFDFFAVQPVERRVRQMDRADEERWLYGLVGAWRKWSEIITLQPYYFILAEQRKNEVVNDREIHTMGFRGFGLIGNTGFDYDFDTAFQFGKDGDLIQRAFASAGELGYTFNHKWKPRLSSWTVYASGDRDPNDGSNNRFDSMFGDGHGFSNSDLFSWRNLISTKLRYEMVPLKDLKFDTAYGGYWLASDSDAWVVPGRRDRTGRSGDFVGTEWDARVRYQIDPRADVELGYSHLFPGDFVKNAGQADGSDFLYLAMTVRLP